MPHQIDIEAARRAAQATRRREQAEREGLLVPDAPPGHRADALRYSIGTRWGVDEAFRHALERHMRDADVRMQRDAEEYQRAVLSGWVTTGLFTPEPLLFNPIPPDLARLVCSALDEALVYVEPIDDDEPWDDDNYVETAEPVRRPQVSSGMMTGFVADDTDFQWDDDSEDDF